MTIDEAIRIITQVARSIPDGHDKALDYAGALDASERFDAAVACASLHGLDPEVLYNGLRA